MISNTVSLIMMLAGLLALVSMIVIRNVGLKKSALAVVVGLGTGLANMLVEYYAAEHGIYFVAGLFPVWHSSLVLGIGWVFLTAGFVLGSELLAAFDRPYRALSAYVAVAIVIGVFSDYLGEIGLGHFHLGPNGNWLHICLIWGALVPMAVSAYRILLKVMG